MQEWVFKILIDGKCLLCRREGRILAWLDRGRNRLVIEDITAAGFDPTGIGVSMQELMGQIHGFLPDGTVVKGMEVFRRAIDLVPKDIIMCDWHYEMPAVYQKMGQKNPFPSVQFFQEKGFRVLPAPWRNPASATEFLRVAKRGVDGYWLELYTDKSQDAVVDLLRKYAELQHEAKGAWRSGQLPFQHPCPDRPAPRAP